MLFLKFQGDKRYTCSKTTTFYIGVFIFIICLFAGKNGEFVEFEKLSRLPPNRNETSIVKNVEFHQIDNKLYFDIEIDYIFSITFSKFLESINVVVKVDRLFYRADQNSFFEIRYNKKRISFIVMVPFSTKSPVELTLNYREIEFFRKYLMIPTVSVILDGKTFIADGKTYTDFQGVCTSNGSVHLFERGFIHYNHTVPSTFDFYNNYAFKDIADRIQNPVIADSSFLFVSDFQRSESDSLTQSFFVMTNYVQQGIGNIYFTYKQYTPLVSIARTLPGVNVLDNSQYYCFNYIRVPIEEKDDTSVFRRLVGVHETGENIVVIGSDEMYAVENLQEYLENEFNGSNLIYVNEKTDPMIYKEAVISAKVIVIANTASMYASLAMPQNGTIYRILLSKDDVVASIETTLAMTVNSKIKYVIASDVVGHKTIVF